MTLPISSIRLFYISDEIKQIESLTRAGIRRKKLAIKLVTVTDDERKEVEKIEEERRRQMVEKLKKIEEEKMKKMMVTMVKRATRKRIGQMIREKCSSLRIEKKRDANDSFSTRNETKLMMITSFSDSRLVRNSVWNSSGEMFQHAGGMPIDADVMMEGYLYKRSSNAFKTWNRRWFQIKENKLLYSHRSNDAEPPTVMEENLMLCLVRPASASTDRVGCFELVTPTRQHLLQADSESLCNDWMRALQRTILALHESDNGVIDNGVSPRSKANSVVSDSGRIGSSVQTGEVTKGRSVSDPIKNNSESPPANLSSTGNSITTSMSKVSTFEQIRRVPGNEVCADCGSPSPKWVSINIGVVLCIECSGVHRSLGVQMSKVRSLTMDSIDNELRDVLLALGNRQVNAIFLKYLPEIDVVPPPANESSTRPVREAWIKAKYVEKRFAVACDERARTSASSRIENLMMQKHKNIGVSGNGVNRSSSYVNVQEAETSSKTEKANETDPWAAELSIPLTNASKRLSSCGSDTALDIAGHSSTSPSSSSIIGQDGKQKKRKIDWNWVKEACESGDLLELLKAHAQGFDLIGLHSGTSALHVATKSGQTAAVEFLLLNGAKINMLDEKLNTPLHLAAQEGNTLQVCQLLKRGADNNLANVEGKTPLDIAMEGTHADIVTLFRVAIMRDEFNEYNNPMDETVDVVISDIARRAANVKIQKAIQKEEEEENNLSNI